MITVEQGITGNGMLAFRSRFSIQKYLFVLIFRKAHDMLCDSFLFHKFGMHIWTAVSVLLCSSAFSLSRPHALKPNCGFSTIESVLVNYLKTRKNFLHRFSITLFFLLLINPFYLQNNCFFIRSYLFIHLELPRQLSGRLYLVRETF